MLTFVPYLSFFICIKNNTKIRGEGLCAVKEMLKPPGSLLAHDYSKAVVLVQFLLNVFGVGVSCCILYFFFFIYM